MQATRGYVIIGLAVSNYTSKNQLKPVLMSKTRRPQLAADIRREEDQLLR